MNDNNARKTRLLEDLDNVRKRIGELEAAEIRSSEAEKDLRNRVERFRLAVENSQVGVFVVGVQGHFQYLNSFLIKRLGFPTLENARETIAWAFPPFVASGIAERLKKCLEVRKQASFESMLDSQKDDLLHVYLNPMFDPDGSISGVLGVMTQFVSQKGQVEKVKTELELETGMHKLLAGLVGYKDFDAALEITLATLGELTGADRTHLFLLYENDTMLDNTHEWCAKDVSSALDQLQNLPVARFSDWMKALSKEPVLKTSSEKGQPDFLENLGIRSSLVTAVHIKDKIAGFLAFSAGKADKEWSDRDAVYLKEIERIIGGFMDRKLEDDALKDRDERLQRLIQAGSEGLLIIDREQVVDGNPMVEALLGWKSSEFIGKPLTDLVEEPDRRAVSENLAQAGSLPFEAQLRRKDGPPLAAELLVRKLSFQDTEQRALTFRDVSSRAAKKETGRKSLAQIKEALYGSIQALAASVALRDPFAAGHVQAVTKLACAIAGKLNLPENRIEGLRIAALVHDIGKIAVPSEILSKPGRLSDAERLLIQDHPGTGYEILKDIDFPWPVARIVHQHHERMDGSGYPEGISGQEIMLEARILAVADTVEAILSPRSSRPAGELKQAVEELSVQKGRLYDADVARAAIEIITAQGFSLKV